MVKPIWAQMKTCNPLPLNWLHWCWRGAVKSICLITAELIEMLFYQSCLFFITTLLHLVFLYWKSGATNCSAFWGFAPEVKIYVDSIHFGVQRKKKLCWLNPSGLPGLKILYWLDSLGFQGLKKLSELNLSGLQGPKFHPSIHFP